MLSLILWSQHSVHSQQSAFLSHLVFLSGKPAWQGAGAVGRGPNRHPVSSGSWGEARLRHHLELGSSPALALDGLGALGHQQTPGLPVALLHPLCTKAVCEPPTGRQGDFLFF